VAEDEPIPSPPEGFVRSISRGPFGAHNGPFFSRQLDRVHQSAFFVLKRHTNRLGLVHGGMLTAFMDTVLAQEMSRSVGRRGVTVHLSVDFLQMARVGDWVIGQSEVTRSTRDLAFVEGRGQVDGYDVVRVSGIFKLMRKAR
jgi:uncharacterized protein (TIGR00369 family)